jgi:hypothetical protein
MIKPEGCNDSGNGGGDDGKTHRQYLVKCDLLN